jgi:hypothetical protein
MRSFLAFTSTPFSKTKFVAYLTGLAVLAVVSFVPRGPQQPVTLALTQDGKDAPSAMFDVVRLGKAADEVLEGMRAAGLPYYLRRAGVTGDWDTSHPGQLIMTLRWDGKRVGRYIDRVEPIDADRTRAYFGFEPGDMALVQRLAARVDTTLDPQGLMRAIEAEHVRASLYDDGFRPGMLKPGAPRNLLSAFTSGVAPEPTRDTDHFPLDYAEQEEANIRQAYRREAESAGAAAPKL